MACGHDPKDIYPSSGDCRACTKEYQARYRKRLKLGMALLRAAADRGLSGYAAIALLQNADPATIEACQAWGIR